MRKNFYFNVMGNMMMRRSLKNNTLKRVASMGAKCMAALMLVLSTQSLKSQITIPAGSYVIDMGVNTSLKPNGLRPYGMIHELVKFYSVPVIWVVRENKLKDAVDYTIEGNAYKGGLFIIPGNYITPTVTSAINDWKAATSTTSSNSYTRGLVTARALASSYTFSGALVDTIKSAPKWTLDATNGAIAQGFLINAGIPSSAYNWVLPSQLGSCNDIFVMPHADPKWSTHGALYDWNLTNKGAIWLGCHAGSALENMYNPSDTSKQTNFLSKKTNIAGTGITLPVSGSTSYSQNSLVLYGAHSGGTVPYNTNTEISSPQTGTYAKPDDWVSQFIGVTDAAHQNGSEQIYLPVLGQGWRPTTKIITYDATQSNVPTNSPGAAVVIAYGPGLGDANRGSVMLEAGHSINKGTDGDVPAQRAFFNWSFQSSKAKAVSVSGTLGGLPASGRISTAISLSISASSQVEASSGLSYSWACIKKSDGTSAGTFSVNNSTSASTTVFTPKSVVDVTDVIFKVAVTDPCGRTTTGTYEAKTVPASRNPVANTDVGSIGAACYSPGITTTVNVLDNDTDADNDINTTSVALVNPSNASATGTTFTVSEGTWFTNGTTVNFTPAANFFGSATISYTVSDLTGGTSTSTVTVGVGAADANGCYPGSTWGVGTETGASAQTNTSITNPDNAKDVPDYDPSDNTTYAEINTNSDILTLDFGALISPSTYDSVAVYFASASQGTSTTIKVEYSTDNISFTSFGTKATSDNDPITEVRYRVPSGGFQYIKITRSSGSVNLWVDAVTIEDWTCVSSIPTAKNDDFAAKEDIPVTFSPLFNDDNPGNLPLKLTIVSQPTHGKVSINTDNTVTYLNEIDYSGTDNFSYKICDTNGSCSTASVTITIENDGSGAGTYLPLSTTETTLTIQGTTSNMIDSYIRKDKTTTNNGNTTSFEIGKKNERRGLFLFNNTNFSTIPTSAVITSAQFSIYRSGGDDISLNLSAHRITQSWTENSVTWNSRDGSNNWTTAGVSIESAPYASITASKDNGYKSFDLTTLVSKWIAGTYTNHGILVKQNSSPLVDKRHQFQQSEGTAAQTPKLVIKYLTVESSSSPIPNRAPLAMPDEYSISTNNALTITSALSNDNDADGNTMSITAVSRVNASKGTVSLSGNEITYTPNNSASVPRTDTLLYTISDGTSTDQAYIYILG